MQTGKKTRTKEQEARKTDANSGARKTGGRGKRQTGSKFLKSPRERRFVGGTMGRNTSKAVNASPAAMIQRASYSLRPLLLNYE